MRFSPASTAAASTAWEEADLDCTDMADFPGFNYSNRAVKRAGEVIAGDMAWTNETEPTIREAFQTANSWRDSHAFPMRSVRTSIIWYMRNAGLTGITAARLKRMQAIRRKLRRIDLSLNQLQDLGGCRVILDSMDDVRALVSAIKERIVHEVWRENDYINEPKSDGYRSHHMIFSYRGRKHGQRDTTIYDGRRIELQVRTRLQHSWATAIEAVGLFRGEELKNHVGNADWLRFFESMSVEFAIAEKCPLPPNALPLKERRKEIVDLAQSLDVVSVLDTVSHGIKGTDIPLVSGYRPSHYLIRYDRATKTVSVEPYSKAIFATQSYDLAESPDNQTGKETQNIVLVEVDKIENLKAAYPNYFGDVDLFRSQLRLLLNGRSAEEFSRLPKQVVKPIPKEKVDASWIGRSRFKRPDEVRTKKNKK